MKRILLVDDDDVIRKVLPAVLQRAGFEVFLAADGRDGMRLLRSQQVDLAVVDVWMPEKDGLETLIEIRRDFPPIKVIVMSGGGQLGFRSPLDWAKRLGADAVLEKPFSNEDLLKAVLDALG